LTVAGETVVHNEVSILGPVNLPAQVPTHASEMYARNLFNFLRPAITDGGLVIDWKDEVFAGAVLTHNGIVRHEATGQATRRMPVTEHGNEGND
jgi:NAD(P) transhydrogenase subunit alpha